MNSGHLRKHILADDGLVGCDGNAAIAFHQSRDGIQLVFVDVGLGMELVFQDYLHARERGIAATLAQSVHRDMQSLAAAEHRSQRIAHRQVVVVVGMEVEVHAGIALLHLSHIFHHLQWVQNAQGVGQHEATDVHLGQRIEHGIDILR